MATPLYLPKEIKVRANNSGDPTAATLNHSVKQVRAIRNTWRIDDEWWREEIGRQYFEVELSNSSVVTIFHDLISGKWYQQRY